MSEMKKIILKIVLFLAVVTFGLKPINALNNTEYFADFYVSTSGNDTWSGKLAEPNASKTDGPFATVNRAKQAVKFFKQGVYRDIFVMIRGGQYRLYRKMQNAPPLKME